jgi:Sec-independent protein translocase protein TatA
MLKKEGSMFPTFFKHKMRKVGSFLRIVKGKVTGNDQERARGVDQAMNAMKDEKKVYQKEKNEARSGVDSDLNKRSRQDYPQEAQDKVIRESGGQDISAI